MKFQNILRLIRTIVLLAVYLYFLERSDEFIEKFLAWCAVMIVFIATEMYFSKFDKKDMEEYWNKKNNR